MNLLFIDWNPSIEVFKIGSFSVRWYALCWILGLLGAYLVMRKLYRMEGIDPAPGKQGKLEPTGKFDPLIFYCFFGVVLGARLGHCLFYEPDYYLSSGKHIIEMFLPVKFEPNSWDWTMTGYSGLASHGGTIGLFLALLLYIRHTKLRTWVVLDLMGLVAPLTSFFIRMGNLMNSEIIGTQTDLPWGFIFHTRESMVNGELVARHPSQLYEAIAYLIIFIIGWRIYKSNHALDPALQNDKSKNGATTSQHSEKVKKNISVGSAFHFGFCLAAIFLFRFFVEFLKEVQGGADDGSTALDMGQMLSIPFILAGLYCMICLPGAKRKKEA